MILREREMYTKLLTVSGLSIIALMASTAFAENDWLSASAPAKNLAVQVIDAPRTLVIEVCAESGNSASILLSTENNPNIPNSGAVAVLPGECSVVSGESLYVSHDSDVSEKPRGYFRYRIR